MREIRQSGSEGGVARKRHPYPYPLSADKSFKIVCQAKAMAARCPRKLKNGGGGGS